MARAGADLVGLNCLFDPFIMLDCMKIMKEALDKEGLHPHLMCQPLGFRDGDAGHFGWVDLPEFPYAIEPRYRVKKSEHIDAIFLVLIQVRQFALLY